MLRMRIVLRPRRWKMSRQKILGDRVEPTCSEKRGKAKYHAPIRHDRNNAQMCLFGADFNRSQPFPQTKCSFSGKHLSIMSNGQG